jgi:TonB-linked SusC/RagA family outer membrane protein
MKKNSDYLSILLSRQLKKILLIMRLSTFLLLITLVNVSAKTFSQDAKLTFNLNNVTVKEVFAEIEKNSTYKFLYRNEVVDVDQKVNIEANSETLDAVLKKLFDQSTIAYRIFEGNIVVITDKSLQQQMKISGKVSDATTSEPLPGVSVQVEGTTNGVITDVNGKFSIDVSTNAVLVFSYLGYISEKVTIGAGQSSVDVKLVADVQKLEEIVVVGYGTQKKESLTGSIVNVGGKEIVKSPSSNLSSSLVGKLPGLIVNQRNGEPGRDDPNILIRGRGTLSSDPNKLNDVAAPLVIIDGVERSLMGRLNPDEIESVSVLKDASAAIYGARAANGVILITTKKGNKGKPVFNFTYNYGLSSPTQIPKMLDAATYAEVYNEAVPGTYSDAAIQKFRDGSDPILYPNTNWAKEELKDYSVQKRVSMQVTGGTEAVRYLLSFGQTDQNGLYKDATSDYKQYNFRAKLDVDLTKNLTVGANISSILGYKEYPTVETWINFTNLLVANPTLVSRYPNGLIAPGRLGENPLLLNQRGYDKIEDAPIYSTFTASYKIPFVKGLKIDASFNYDLSNQFEKLYKKPYYYYEYNVLTNQYDYKKGTGTATVELTDTYNKWTTMLYNYKISYEGTFNKHHVAAMAGQEQQKNRNTWARAYRKNFVSPAIDQINVGSSASADKDNGGSMTENSYNNFFGRVNYDYATKYLIEFLFRYDGSPKFPADKRYGFNPCVSVGWRLSEEGFIKNNLPFVNQLKLRASYGELGNDRIDPYQYMQSYAFGSNYVFGKTDAPGIKANTPPNRYITWEVSKKTDLGLETSLWDGKLGFDFTYWMEKRNNILWDEGLKIPAVFGFPALPQKNIGKVDNHGFELVVKHRSKIGKLTYNIEGSTAFARNKINYIAETQTAGYEAQWQTGRPIGTSTYYKTDGIFHTQEELNAYPHQAGQKIGDIKIVDLNGDSIIDSKDMYRSKYTSTPEITFGLNISLQYKNFDFSMFFQGQTNAYNYDDQFASLGASNFDNAVVQRANNHWSETNKNGTMPRVRQYTPGTTDFFLYDATFVRLKNIDLGYTLPKSLISKIKLDDVRIFVSGFNVLTWAKEIKWTDPELNGNILYYPPQRIFSMGINVKF